MYPKAGRSGWMIVALDTRDDIRASTDDTPLTVRVESYLRSLSLARRQNRCAQELLDPSAIE